MSVRFTPAFERAAAYKPAPPAPTLRLDLSGNEGRGPDTDTVTRAVAEWTSRVRRYPDTDAVTEAVAALRGVGREQVLVTNGGDDAIDRACRVSLCPGRNAVVPAPTFEMIPRYVKACGADLRTVSADPTRIRDEAVRAIDDATGFVAIVSPNNPSGEVTNASVFVDVARAAPHALVLADLAYVEFADADPTEQLLREPNIVVVRTLSKAWGLAGLRVGYALGAPDVIARVRAAGGPYAVSGLSAAIAARWLTVGRPAVDAFVAQVRREIPAIRQALGARGWPSSPSHANFVTVQHPNVATLANALLADGIRVRSWPNDPERCEYARITCPGDPDELELLLRSIESVPYPETP
jgi:histidinol-phosphate aminotransferase